MEVRVEQLNMEVRAAEQTDISDILDLLRVLFSIEADFLFDEANARAGVDLLLRNPDTSPVFVASIHQKVNCLCLLPCMSLLRSQYGKAVCLC